MDRKLAIKVPPRKNKNEHVTFGRPENLFTDIWWLSKKLHCKRAFSCLKLYLLLEKCKSGLIYFHDGVVLESCHWSDFQALKPFQFNLLISRRFCGRKKLEVESKARPFFIATFISLINGCLGADNARWLPKKITKESSRGVSWREDFFKSAPALRKV